MATIQLALLVDRLMRQIHVSLQANSAEFDTRDVGPMGGMVLLTLADTGPCDMHVLTQLMARDKSQMTRIIKALEAKDCVARETSARDARVSVIYLTSVGDAVVQDLRIALSSAIGELLSGLDPAETTLLEDLLLKALSPKAH